MGRKSSQPPNIGGRLLNCETTHSMTLPAMYRTIRFSLLGLVLALPFAMPQSSEAAAPAGTVWYRPLPRWPIIVVNPIRVWHPIGIWQGPVFIRR